MLEEPTVVGFDRQESSAQVGRSSMQASTLRELVMDDNRRREGARAFNRGMERDQCPHAPGTPAFRSWVDGWKQQKAEFQLRLESERSAIKFARAV